MMGQIYVWDRFVRIFHWLLVAFFCISYLTGEEEHWIHTYSGYAIFTLISLRVIWGFIGSKHARFADFIYSPGSIVRYLASLTTASPKRYRGHNPAWRAYGHRAATRPVRNHPEWHEALRR